MKIENGTFSATRSLKSITLPDSVKEVGKTAFEGSGIETVRWRGYELHRSFGPEEVFFDRLWFTKYFTADLVLGRIDRDDGSAGAISAELDKAMELIFEADNVRALEALIEDGRFFTAGNIGGYIDAAAKTEKHELYLMLVGHKESLGGSGGDRFGL